MAVFRVERNKGYTVMSNHHLRNKELTLKAKGLLSQMLSLPEDWDYTLKGLSHINRESIDAIRTAIWELEQAGYIARQQGRDDKGKMTAIAGSGKIGKSWLALDMCVAVSTGSRLWDYKASHGDVLYLALEDTHPRLQNRLQLIQEENINTDNLHLAISSLGISDGLITQMKEFLNTNPSTKLIVIDTLERIRNTDQDKSMYACDYRDMTALREITNAHAVTLLLVHHTRKMYDPDPLNTLSGSTGLVGAVDGVWVLEKEKRIGDKGKLTIANRDTEGYCFSVLFDKENCRWNCLGTAEDVADQEQNSFCIIIDEFVKTVWRGTSTGLCEAMAKAGIELGLSSAAVTKMLNKNKDILQADYGIVYSYDRSKSERIITLSRVDDDR